MPTAILKYFALLKMVISMWNMVKENEKREISQWSHKWSNELEPRFTEMVDWFLSINRGYCRNLHTKYR